jgi:hypothetical protein
VRSPYSRAGDDLSRDVAAYGLLGVYRYQYFGEHDTSIFNVVQENYNAKEGSKLLHTLEATY